MVKLLQEMEKITLKNAKFKEDFTPLEDCDCYLVKIILKLI